MPNPLASIFKFTQLDPRLRAELATQRRPLRIGFLCTVVTALTTPAAALLLNKIITSVEDLAKESALPSPKQRLEKGFSEAVFHAQEAAAKMAAMHSLLVACGMIVGLYALRYTFVRGQTYYLSEASNRLAMDLRLRMLTKLLRLPIGYYNDRRSGAIQSVLTNDVNVYQNAVGLIRDSVGAPMKALAGLVVVIYFQWKLALLASCIIPVMAFLIQRNGRRMRRFQSKVQADLANLNATTVEVLQGTRVVKAFGAEARTQQQYERLVEDTFHSQMAATANTAYLAPMQDLIGAVSLSAILYICGLLAGQGGLTVGAILAIGYSLDQINQGARAVGGISNTYAMVQAASDRIYREILDVPEYHEAQTGFCPLAAQGEIRFENVSFSYPDGTEALRNVSFVLAPGTSLALVGSSGAGKSTIADLLLRFYDPTCGTIYFDGQDIKTLDISWLRGHIGTVPQQTFLFADTIEANVRVGNPDASDDEVVEALSQAHATEFAKELKERKTAELGERGIRLSGGQMQRVAIARALVRKPTVLLLDEATSALDATSEKAVTEALAQVMKTRTTLFIAHRLTTAARADRILVLSRGEVVEIGSHQELLAANGSYAALFKAFSGGILV